MFVVPSVDAAGVGRVRSYVGIHDDTNARPIGVSCGHISLRARLSPTWRLPQISRPTARAKGEPIVDDSRPELRDTDCKRFYGSRGSMSSR
jgi:hypothetical protein